MTYIKEFSYPLAKLSLPEERMNNKIPKGLLNLFDTSLASRPPNPANEKIREWGGF